MKTWPIKLLNKQAKMPERAYEHAIGYDVFAFGDHVINPGQTRVIPLGFFAALEPGYGAFVWDRGGMGTKGMHTFHELVYVTADMEVIPFAGVIDPDYRGQWGVVLHNFSTEIFKASHGFKVAQVVIVKCELPSIVEVDELPDTERGAKCLGSSDQGTTAAAAQAHIAGGGSSATTPFKPATPK